MRLAICFFGQARFLENKIVRSRYLDLIEQYNADVYVHSWISGSSVEIPLSCSSWVPCIYESSDASRKIIEWFNPTKYKFDSPFTGNLSARSETIAKTMESYSARNELAILSHLKSIEEVVNLIDEPEQYDFILMTRFDVMLEKFPNLLELDSNKFYIRWQPNMWWYDAAQLCGAKFIKAFDTWKNIDVIVEYLYHNDRRFYPELFKRRQYEIAECDTKSVVYTKDLDYCIVRSNDGLNNVLR